MRTYCTCSKNDYICRGLHNEPLTWRFNYLWVHAGCGLPFPLVWASYIRRCESCLKQVCLPWEVYCQQCYKYEYGSTKGYKGLLAAAKRVGKWSRSIEIVSNTPVPKSKGQMPRTSHRNFQNSI